MSATWSLGDVHYCALTSFEHKADEVCVAYAVEHGDSDYRPTPAPAAGIASELARLRRTVGTVRDLHPRVSVRDNLGRPSTVCGGCSDAWGDLHVWPCPTVRALDEEAA